MNREMMKKAGASKIVDVAVQTAKMPNQVCLFFMGKAKTEYDLTSDDYENISRYLKKRPL